MNKISKLCVINAFAAPGEDCILDGIETFDEADQFFYSLLIVHSVVVLSADCFHIVYYLPVPLSADMSKYLMFRIAKVFLGYIHQRYSAYSCILEAIVFLF